MDDSFGHWLAGFIDGEGSFQIKPLREGRAANARFSLTLRADDRPILEQIHQTLGIGKVYGKKAQGVNPQAIWDVWRVGDMLQLIEVLERYPLRGKKAADFVMWSEAIRVSQAAPKGLKMATLASYIEPLRCIRAYQQL